MTGLALMSPPDPQRPIAFRDGHPVLLALFRHHVAALLPRLPAGTAMINLCQDRYRFLVAYAAALSAGHPVLLPPSRVEQVVAEIQGGNPGSYRCEDAVVEEALEEELCAAAVAMRAERPIPGDRVVMVGITSGSTGEPKSYPKRWRSAHGSTLHNSAAIRRALGIDAGATPWILATVPPQHMYGMELSVLLPLIGGMAVHAARPLFAADIARALEELPQPRILASTPVHLRALLESSQPLPSVALVISATAPLDGALAAAVERRLGAELLEMFGSTETCVIASRRTAQEASWRLYEEVELQALPQGTRVDAPWFPEPVVLQDIIEPQAGGRFLVRGRHQDLIEVAGKRASLADLTRRLLALEGVRDAVVFQPDADAVASIRRVAALVVAPGMSRQQILERLAPGVDPAFLPRPLRVVDALPRDALGKLPRERLLQALHSRRSS